jgi:hypothetical protein
MKSADILSTTFGNVNCVFLELAWELIFWDGDVFY